MPEPAQPPRPLDRRAFLTGTTIVGGGLLAEGLLAGPAYAGRPAQFGLVRSGRPVLTHGVQSGDVTADGAVVWARADRPVRMLVELTTSESFQHARLVRGPVVTPATDLTGRLDLRGLRPGQQFLYRVSLQDLHDPTLLSAPLAGRFRTAPARRSEVSFTWSGDTAGQGWGIIEAVANGDPRLLGRELEIAALLRALKRRGVANLVWLTADVHYTAAHHYHPDRAVFQEFSPFWEFVSGPLNAGTFGPNALDPTFGPRVEFQRFAPTPNQPPSAGLQFFGHVTIDGATGVMTVRLKDLAGQTLYQVELEPA